MTQWQLGSPEQGDFKPLNLMPGLLERGPFPAQNLLPATPLHSLLSLSLLCSSFFQKTGQAAGSQAFFLRSPGSHQFFSSCMLPGSLEAPPDTQNDKGPKHGMLGWERNGREESQGGGCKGRGSRAEEPSMKWFCSVRSGRRWLETTVWIRTGSCACRAASFLQF